MKIENECTIYSATDLANFLGCRHATSLDVAALTGVIEKIYRHDSTLELLIELGQRHEARYVETLRNEGRQVLELPSFSDPDGSRTRQAMADGVEVIAQASLTDDNWRGYADFLIKVDSPSDLGEWSYEVFDAKLSQNTRASVVLQLCLYGELVSKIQGILPAEMHVVKPGDPFEIESMRVKDYMSFYRMAKKQFLVEVDGEGGIATQPEPCSHCSICSWWPRCDQEWREKDHLSLVAGISKSQRIELAEQGVNSLREFAESDTPLKSHPKRGAIESYERVHRQARIQLKGRQTEKPEYEFNDVEHDRGFQLLPEPNEGDLFFDIEGNPRAIDQGLEYLLGYVTIDDGTPTYHRLWALDEREERERFVEFVDFVMERWKQFPGMHIYHYAPYEPSALKRLMTRYATREDEVDNLLRGKKLIDLYAVTRQAIRASVESYSIKSLEPFYEFEREEELSDASKALRQIERLIELGMADELTDDHKAIIESYNKDDCLSTLRLRDWFEKIRLEAIDEGLAINRPEAADPEAKDSVKEMSAAAKRVFDLLTDDIDEAPQSECQRGRWHFAHMLEFFRREGKCAWWDFFHLAGMKTPDLLLENGAVADLHHIGENTAERKGKLPIHRYEYPAQECILEKGDQLWDVNGVQVGTVHLLDEEQRVLEIKKTGKTVDYHPDSIFEFRYVDPGSMPESLFEFGTSLAAAAKSGNELLNARSDLLYRRSPRLKVGDISVGNDVIGDAITIAQDLDGSYLPIQGPPGSGKTYLGSHLIYSLAKSGKAIGVTAIGHEVIRNLLEAVNDRALEDNSSVALGHQVSDKHELPSFIERLANRKKSLKAIDEGKVVGGTAWLWSHEESVQQLDYLFIDEAGQMSLAMAIAAGRAAKNIVLLGDPQQLEQPQQAVHPHDSGVAALAHVLNGEDTMPSDRGLFLKDTWRLHPHICDFTSEQYYSDRLSSRDGLEIQQVRGSSNFVGSGLNVVTVPHMGNQNRSREEVERIVEIHQTLTDGSHQWASLEDGLAAFKTIGCDDVLVVAPFNAQVSALRDALPAARVGTVDKFQGQEAPVVIYSMTSSSAEDAPRGIPFLYSRNRMNVATSRAKCLAILVCSPQILAPNCNSPEQIRLANGVCRFHELSQTHGVSIQ